MNQKTMDSSYIKKPHAIMIAAPYQGHFHPFVDLALKLASNGFRITFVHFEFIHHKLSKSHKINPTEFDIFSEAKTSCLDIHYTTINDGFPIEFDRDIHLEEFWQSLFEDFPARADEFVGRTIKSNPSTAHFLLVDTIFHWGASIAEKHKLVYVAIWIGSALVFSLNYHMEILRENGHLPCQDNIEEEIKYMPGVETINTRDLMSYFKEAEFKTFSYKLFYKAFKEVKKADFILQNTVHELEPDSISTLNRNSHKNYAIGPISFSKSLPKSSTTVAKSLWSKSDCAQWLDSKSPGSVLYVSFGSLVYSSKQVLREIAYGLLLSEVNFIWVVRSNIVSPTDTDDTEVLPTGFIDEIKDKGLIIPWCNQMMVLSNPAVGGFLTHCGWNSIFESSLCGIPMICYPIAVDQSTNKKLVVDDWKIGIDLCDVTSSGSGIHRDEVAKKIRTFMSNSKELKQETKKVQGIIQSAIEVDGSSERNFDQFVKELKEKIYLNNEEFDI